MSDDALTFTLDRLAGLLEASHEKVFWRHDVDYDLGCAVKMAEFEAEHGVTSTYYIRAHAQEYRPSDPAYAEALVQISSFGHQLAAHVDLKLPREAMVSELWMRAACIRQSALLGFDPQRLVSFHAPPHDALWRDVQTFTHAMGPAWKDRYVADSRGVFRRSPEEALATGESVQINLHPEWWFLPEAEADRMRVREMANP